MKLNDCIAVYRAISENADKNLGMRNNYNVSLNIKSLETIIKPFDEVREKMLSKLQDKYGEEEVPEKEVKKFNAELVKILEEDHEVTLKNIKIGDIPSKTDLSAAFFVACQEIVTE